MDYLLRQRVSHGGCAVLQDKDRYIYYLVTKQRCYGRATYRSLETSLCAARDHCIDHKITKISMRQIACGLDGLEWKRVANVIDYVFRETDIFVTVYLFK